VERCLITQDFLIRFRHLAVTDPLTGLFPNYRTLINVVSGKWQRLAPQPGVPFRRFLLLDLDGSEVD